VVVVDRLTGQTWTRAFTIDECADEREREREREQ
jgi:hypothetical protein